MRGPSFQRFALGALLVLASRSAVGAPMGWGPTLLAPRIREPLRLTTPTPFVEGYAAILGAGFTPKVRGHVELALGGGADGPSGTFACDMLIGRLLANRSPNEGLILRGGVDLFVDSLGASRVTRFSLPQIELGYARYKPNYVVDVVLAAGPVLFSRMRYGDRLERFPIAPQVGPRLLLHYEVLGLRVDSGFLPVSTAPGGPALWSRAVLCYAPSWLAACADGFFARIEPASHEPVGFGYVGLSAGFNFEQPWESNELP